MTLGLLASNPYTQCRQGQAGRLMNIRYNVLFAGEVLNGQDVLSVRSNLGRLFKADDATVDKLFSGKPQLLKRDCEAAVAEKYRHAIESAGGKAIIQQAPLAAPPASTELTIAPPGSDVLRPEERAATVTAKPVIPALEVAEPGARLAEPAAAAPPPPDTSHLTLGAAGATIPNLQATTATVIPESHWSVAKQGSDLREGAAQVPEPKPVDTSQLSLAPAGADVLETRYRKTSTATAPDTSALSLADPPPQAK